ncbi:MAG: SUMF1/EgtB/PvdO family nonheme iron enzyme [Deltaproteobacteria bacterium]|nr:SUMF1/EgtB/PvdO family nonheme iron enzyme [Deltaproteobacteria bacterium]
MKETNTNSGGRTGSGPVLRGGAFNNNARDVRCAYRNRNNPDNRNNNIGFRVVLAHGFSILPEMRDGPFQDFSAEALWKAGAVRSRPRP